MNKVVTINLGGRAYQLEESGYDALHAYLDEASARLFDDPGKAEIIADLEQAISEKCDRVLNPHKTVVSADEVKKIIEEMGPVEGGTGDENTEKHDTNEEAKRDAQKRLYRISEGEMIFGVCNGLAAYFGLDVALVRTGFVILAILTGGGFCLAYFVMMLVIPEAGTMQEKAAAHGEPFNAETLVQRAKERWSEGYERVTGNKWDDVVQGMGTAHEQHLKWREMRKQQKQQWKQQWKQQMRHDTQQRYHPNPVLGLLRGVLGIIWIFTEISLITTGAIFGWMLPAGVPIWAAMIVLFIVFQAVVGPMKAARYSPTWDGGYQWGYSEWDGLVDGLTVLFLAIAFIWAYTQIPQVYSFVHHPILDTKQLISDLRSWWHR